MEFELSTIPFTSIGSAASTTKRIERFCAEKARRDLQILHKDTCHLAYGLMEEYSLVLERFHDANRHLVFSTLKQVRSRHAYTVETLANVLIAL